MYLDLPPSLLWAANAAAHHAGPSRPIIHPCPVGPISTLLMCDEKTEPTEFLLGGGVTCSILALGVPIKSYQIFIPAFLANWGRLCRDAIAKRRLISLCMRRPYPPGPFFAFRFYMIDYPTQLRRRTAMSFH